MKILVVDDNPDIRRMSKYVLEAARPVDVRLAESGMEAIEILAEWGAELIMLDSVMPIMNGLKTLEAIRQWWPQIPVVFFTTDVSNDRLKSFHSCLLYTSPSPRD